MLARLLLALLLTVGAAPSAAMPAGCHDGAAMNAMARPAAPTNQRQHQAPGAEHGCIGCAALGHWLGEPLAAPLLVPAMAPVAVPLRLSLGRAPPPMLKPPRIG